MKLGLSLRPALLAGALPLIALLPGLEATATTCSDGAAATIDTTNCTVAAGTVPTTVTFAASPTGALVLNGASPTGAINATTASQGNITVQAATTLAAGATIGATTSIANITVNSGQSLDASAVSTIRANNIILGNGSANGVLTLGNTTLTVAGRLDGDGGGGGNLVVINGAATINGLIGNVMGTDIRVNDGRSLTTNSSTYRATTTLGSAAGGGASLTLNGTTSVQGWINGDAAGNGTLVVNGTSTLASGINVGSTNRLAQITVMSGGNLSAVNGGTIAATNITVGQGGGNGTLTLGNTTVTTTGMLDGAGGTGNAIVVAGNATINGAVGAVNGIDTRVNDGQSLTTTGNLRSTIRLGSGSGADATLTMQGTSTLQGVINGSATGHGNVVIDGAITSDGASMGSSVRLNNVSITAGNSLAMNGSASINAGTVTIGNGATLTMNAGRLTGAVDGAAANQGNLVFNRNAQTLGVIGGTNALSSVSVANSTYLAMSHNIAANTVALGDNSTLYAYNARTLAGTLTMKSSTLSLQDSGLTVTNGVSIDSGKTARLISKLGSTAGYMLDITGGTLTLGNAASSLSVSPWLSGRTAQDGDKFIIVNSANAAVLNGGSITGPASSGMITWATRVATAGDAGTDVYGTTINAGQDVILVASLKKASEVEGTDKDKVKVIDTLPTNPTNPKGTELVAALQNLSSASQLNDAGTQLKPETGRGSVEAAIGSTTQALAVVGNRAETIRTASSGRSGVSTGEMLEGAGVWGEGFGHLADQGRRGTSDGYRSSTAGFAAGGDTRLAEPLRVGLAGTYSQTWMDEKGARERNGNDIKSYGAILYSSYAGEPWYLDTSLAVALHRYTSQRGIGFGGFTGTAYNKHDGVQYTAKTEFGYPFTFGATTLTPLANLTWTRLVQEAYEEYGPTAANLAIGEATTDSLTHGIGAKLSQQIGTSYGTLVPELRLTWLHEYKANAPETTARFAAGGAAFTSEGVAPARNGAMIGLGLTLLANDAYELSANVDVEIREQYIGQSGRIRLRTNF